MDEGEYWVVVIEQKNKKTYHHLRQKASAKAIYEISLTEINLRHPFVPTTVSLYWFDEQHNRHLIARTQWLREF